MRNFFLLAGIFLILNGCAMLLKQKKDKIIMSFPQKSKKQQTSSRVKELEDKQINKIFKRSESEKTDPLLKKIKYKQSSQLYQSCLDFPACLFSLPPRRQNSRKSGNLSEKQENSNTIGISKKMHAKQKGISFNKDKKSQDGNLKFDCNLSDRSQKKINSYMLSFSDSFVKEQNDLEELFNVYLDNTQNGWPNKCPKHCSVVNDYSIFAKSYPVSVNKNSCDKGEAKEIYKLSKQFLVEGDTRTDKQKAYNKASDWLFSVFVKPFLPFSKNLPKEVVENKIEKACPSCSFYLDYSYKYTKDNHLDLKVTARCGARRTFFSKFKSEFILVNNWKCEKKRSEKANFKPM